MQERELVWKRHEIAAFGLALDVLNGVPVLGGGTEERGWLMQSASPVHIGLWYGPGQTIERWRDGFGAWQGVGFGREQTTVVCGHPALRQEAMVPEQPGAEGAFAGPEGVTAHGLEARPAMTAVVVSFEHRGIPVLVGWQIDTAERKAYQAAEEHFFAALQCL